MHFQEVHSTIHILVLTVTRSLLDSSLSYVGINMQLQWKHHNRTGEKTGLVRSESGAQSFKQHGITIACGNQTAC